MKLFFVTKADQAGFLLTNTADIAELAKMDGANVQALDFTEPAMTLLTVSGDQDVKLNVEVVHGTINSGAVREELVRRHQQENAE